MIKCRCTHSGTQEADTENFPALARVPTLRRWRPTGGGLTRVVGHGDAVGAKAFNGSRVSRGSFMFKARPKSPRPMSNAPYFVGKSFGLYSSRDGEDRQVHADKAEREAHATDNKRPNNPCPTPSQS